jgi:hypothetical protein
MLPALVLDIVDCLDYGGGHQWLAGLALRLDRRALRPGTIKTPVKFAGRIPCLARQADGVGRVSSSWAEITKEQLTKPHMTRTNKI